MAAPVLEHRLSPRQDNAEVSACFSLSGGNSHSHDCCKMPLLPGRTSYSRDVTWDRPREQCLFIGRGEFFATAAAVVAFPWYAGAEAPRGRPRVYRSVRNSLAHVTSHRHGHHCHRRNSRVAATITNAVAGTATVITAGVTSAAAVTSGAAAAATVIVIAVGTVTAAVVTVAAAPTAAVAAAAGTAADDFKACCPEPWYVYAGSGARRCTEG